MQIAMWERNSRTLLNMKNPACVLTMITSGEFTLPGLYVFASRRNYISDYNFVRHGDECIPVGPEPIEAGVCKSGRPDETYKGSSGFRKIPGNTCTGGVKKDEKVDKKCSQGMVKAFLVWIL
jgi:hypothetical protein